MHKIMQLAGFQMINNNIYHFHTLLQTEKKV